MATLDPDLELALRYETPQRLVQLILDWPGTGEELALKGARLLAPIEDGAALVELPLGTVATLLDDPTIGHMSSLPGFVPELDVSRAVVKTPNEVVAGADGKPVFKGSTGIGVTIGVIDADLDVFHQSLRNPDGTTRFLSLWDMNPSGKVAKVDGLKPPDGFARGLVYGKADVDLALSLPIAGEDKRLAKRRQKLSGNLRMLRGSGHGTRVASIAAGNGRLGNGAYGPHCGIAPESHLVGVVMRSPHDWAMAMRFLRKAMLGKPGVMNLSAGEHHGPHLPDGRVERWFKAFIDSSGIPLVKSAGNGRGLAGHATSTIKKEKGEDLQLIMAPSAAQMTSRVRVQIWYGYGGGDPELGATIKPPGGPVYDIPYDAPCNAPTAVLNASNRKRPDHLGLSAIVLWLKPKPGVWTIRLTAPKSKDVKWHGWISWSASRHNSIGFGPPSMVTNDCTISVPVAVPNMVTVSSFVTKDGNGGTTPDHKLAPSSARGPAADGTTAALTVAAPGQAIAAAVPPDPNANEPPPGTTDRYARGAGTSFAAPHVTGAIALMLQKNPKLTPAEIVGILRMRNSAEVLDEKDWGAGKLDIEKVLNRVPAAR